MIMNHKLLKFTPGDALKFTLASSLIVLLGGCASSAASDNPAPQADASQPAATQANSDASAAQGQLVAPSQRATSASQLAVSQDAASDQSSQAQTEQNSARVSALESELAHFGAQRKDDGMVITLNDRLFSHGHARFLPGNEQNIAALAGFFKQHPEVKATINGYSDNAGSFDANLKLSQGRADEITKQLENQGVPAASLSTHAYGQIGWVASNKTAQGRMLNRRVEIVFDLAGATSPAQ
jgi:outer membrane protein OmpA-like peptidoglycan-associated protein